MKRIALLVLIASLWLTACGQKFDCSDPLSCVTVGSGESITIAVALTLSGRMRLMGLTPCAAWNSRLRTAENC